MKKVILYTAVALSIIVSTTSCSDFGDVNNDPEHLNTEIVDYRMVFTGMETMLPGYGFGDVWRNGIIYCANMLQHTSTVGWKEGIFYTYNSGLNESFWGLYQGEDSPIRNAYLIMQAWKDKPGYENGYQMCRIARAYILQRATDLYGDVPYFDASKGFDGIGYPRYDKQQDIYNDLLKELDEAQAALDPSLTSSLTKEDIIFKGDVLKWKRFANSLMVRVAMRLSKVDPALAETWVKKAVSNGTFTNINESAIIQHQDGGTTGWKEPYGDIYSDTDSYEFFLSEYFVNLLKNNNDPRLPLIGTVCSTNPRARWNDSEPFDYGNCNPEIQVGMPTGYDQNGENWDISKAPGYPGDWPKELENKPAWSKFETYYSRPNRYTYGRPDAPSMLVTYAETQLLLAEAAHRGWITGKSAQDYYNEGVTAAMEQFAFYTPAKEIYDTYLKSDAIEKYLQENPFDPTKALEQINTQYYITTFCDEYEAFSNWRRTGFPTLTPVNKNYPMCVTNGTIPRRFTYPTSEAQVNATNYQEAISRLTDGDKMTSRVWWDKEE